MDKDLPLNVFGVFMLDVDKRFEKMNAGDADQRGGEFDLDGTGVDVGQPFGSISMAPGTIKIKLAASLIGISSIHLLKSFVDIEHEDPEHIKWKIFIHMTFLGSAILLAWTDKIMQRERKH